MTGSVRQPVTSDTVKNSDHRTANNVAPGVFTEVFFQFDDTEQQRADGESDASVAQRQRV